MSSADVLILTALQDELEAVLALGDGGRAGWDERRDGGGFRYHHRVFPSERGGEIAVAAAWSGEGGARTAMVRGQHLLGEIDPACLAVCGICAGDGRRVALGDVIVADQIYAFDDGKIIAEPGEVTERFHALRTFDLPATWQMDAAYLAREIELSALSRARPPSRAAQRRWLLHALHAHEAEGGPAPAAHPDRRSACPGWTQRVREALAEGLIVATAGHMALTDEGRAAMLEERIVYPDGVPDDPPLRVHVGAIATVTAVVQDPALWDRLQRLVRTTIGLEMEGAAIGLVATSFQKRAILVKAVGDHADLDKDDSFRAFACRAAAEVLLTFLSKHIEGRAHDPAPPQRPAGPTPPVAAPRPPTPRRPAIVAPSVQRPTSRPIKVFYSYAPEDDGLRVQLEKHLAVRRGHGMIDGWHHGRIRAGEDWKGAVRAQLDAARVVILLVSSDFLASEHCREVEMPRALARQHAGEALVIPILVRACDWRHAPFARLRVLPEDERPVTSWKNLDEAWENVALAIGSALDEVAGPRDGWAAAATSSEPLFLVDDLDFHRLVGRPAARAPSPEPPVEAQPVPQDGHVQGLRDQLVAARARRARLTQHGQGTADVEVEILSLRRALRAGGQLHEGDALGDGRYVLLRRLGKGGFAVVWEAHDEVRGERVAIKVLHPDLTREASRVERFFRGARAMAELDHPAVVRVLDRRGEDEGWLYFVMEFVPGGDLRRAVLDKRLGAREVLAVVRRVGEALAAAHAKGQIHRDVKPAYILLDADGAPRLTDFDLVGAADTTGGTRTGAMGTFLYAAPELMDRPQDADARVDVYGLGMTAISGLYGGDLPMTMVRDGDRIIDGLSCNARTKAALKKAVAWERDERFESVEDFCQALSKSLEMAGVDVETGEPRDASEHLPEVLAAHGAIEPAWTDNGPRCLSVAWSPLGDLVASGHGDGIVRVWDVVSGQALRTLSAHSGPVYGVAFSQDGEFLASGSEDKTVRLWSVRGSGAFVRTFEEHTHEIMSVAFSPDDHMISLASLASPVQLLGVATGTILGTLRGHTDGTACVKFSPEGTILASGSYDKTVRLWDVATRRSLRTFKKHTGAVMSVAFSSNTSIMASGSDDKTVQLWDVATGRTMPLLASHARGVTSVAFAPDDETIASGSSDHAVCLWHVTTGGVLRTFDGHRRGVTSVAFSPDGRTVASASLDGTLRLWDVATARCLAILLGAPEGWAAFTPDGRYKRGGEISGSFWHADGLRRFEPGELDPYLPDLRLPDDASFLTLPPPKPHGS